MHHKGKKHGSQVVAPDILSSLPENIIDAILMHLPLRDAVRTSILSNVWSPLLEQSVLSSAVTNHIQIRAPKLRSFDFTGDLMFLCLEGLPLLEKLSLVDTEFSGETGKCGIAKFLESFPALKHLHLDYFSVPFFAGEVPKQLSSALNSLQRLYLYDISLDELDVASCALYLIKSSPLLQEIELELYDDRVDPAARDVINEILEKVKGLSNVTFNHIRVVKLTGITGANPEMQLIKLLLANSPMLSRMLIHPEVREESSKTSLEILAEITQFRQASPKAEVVYKLT